MLQKIFKQTDVECFERSKLSTDEQPTHQLCPKGELSWCKFQKAQVTGESYAHKSSIPLSVMETIKPIFRDLTSDELLSKCQHGHTQNPNESFNHTLWSRIPKEVFVGYHTLKMGALDAAVVFNEGALGRVQVLTRLEMGVSKNTYDSLKRIDSVRVRKAEKEALEATKEVRVKKRQLKRKLDDTEDQDRGQYSGGAF